MSKKYIKDLHEGDLVSSYFGVLIKSLRKTKTDKDYLDLILIDRTGRINAKVWDKIENVKDSFEKGDAVAIKGQVVSFNEEIQIKVDSIRCVDLEIDKKYGFNFLDLFPTTEKNIDKMWNEVQEFIQSIQDPYLKSVVSDIYSKFEDLIKIYPASMMLHHPFRGGLLEHIHSMSKLAVPICENYPELNRDLVLSGILLHDIGKLRELEPDLATSYTDEGNFIGHIVLGRDILLEAISRIDNFPEILKLKLEHIILSHQGKYEWQCPKEPEFLEALIVYFIDVMDTRVNQMKNEIELDNTDGDWTSKKNYFHRPLYKGDE